MNEKKVREQLAYSFDWDKAHENAVSLFSNITHEFINEKAMPNGRTLWDLLEHLRICQFDILDFIRNPNYKDLSWPDDYWPPEEEVSFERWEKSKADFFNDSKQLKKIALDPSLDITAPLAHAPDYTILRELILVTNHNSYHLGQFALARRSLGI